MVTPLFLGGCASPSSPVWHGEAALPPHSLVRQDRRTQGQCHGTGIQGRAPALCASHEGRWRLSDNHPFAVITSKDLQKHGNIWVCPVSDHVCTRFFFVYEDGQVGDANINTQDPKIQKEIMRVIGTQVYTN
uniref:Uncharacterized protein n=1 Tax=Gopherus evgoodei TaxID=1825980 RepID=A0A8C4YG63_9SAUR